ncbi:MAG TPA: sugar kinase [Terriglobales bacterium]
MNPPKDLNMPRFDVTLAGELNLDLILYGLPEELPPERELLADDMMLTLGGSSSIVAHNLAALGCRVGFISKIGNDPLGEIALERLRESGVDVGNVLRDTKLKTGLTVILARTHWRNILTYMGTISELGFEDLDFEYLCDSRHFHLSSYYLQRKLQPGIIDLFRKLKAAGVTISLDTNDDPEGRWEDNIHQVLKLVDVFMPNEREAKAIGGSDDLETAVERLAHIVPLIVVKAGPRGALARRGKERFECRAVSVEIVDAVGAGDSFNAGFLSQFVQGAPIESCLTVGNQTGAKSTTQPGGTEAFRKHRQIGSKA